MSHKKELLLSVSCFLLAFLLYMAYARTNEESLAARIAPEILRFHVLANSDSEEDQQLKLEVRTLLLNTIYEDLGSNATKEETCRYIKANENKLIETAEHYMEGRGYPYTASIELTTSYFPEKIYGDMTFPPGSYEACRVILGKGGGKNWWCVLYPPLCFTDAVSAEVPEDSKEILEHVLAEEDYRSLLTDKHANVRLSFKLLETLKKIPQKEIPSK